MLSLHLDELEHQALDLLEDLPATTSEASAGELGVDPDELRDAIERVHALLVRLAADHARVLLRALELVLESGVELVGIERPEPAAIERARELLVDEPSLALSVVPTIEVLTLALGLQPGTKTSALIDSLREQTEARARELGFESVAQLVERVSRSAWPTTSVSPSETERVDTSPALPVALRVFRMTSVEGTPLRARALAADAPDDLDLAEALIADSSTETIDAATLIDRFDRARAERAADRARAQQASVEQPAAQIDGPKRRFTVVHLVLALIVLGLTIWHYWLR